MSAKKPTVVMLRGWDGILRSYIVVTRSYTPEERAWMEAYAKQSKKHKRSKA